MTATLVGAPAALKSSFSWDDETVVLVTLTHAAADVFVGISSSNWALIYWISPPLHDSEDRLLSLLPLSSLPHTPSFDNPETVPDPGVARNREARWRKRCVVPTVFRVCRREAERGPFEVIQSFGVYCFELHLC